MVGEMDYLNRFKPSGVRIHTSFTPNSGYNYDELVTDMSADPVETTRVKTYSYGVNTSYEDDYLKLTVTGTSSHAYRSFTLKKPCIYVLDYLGDPITTVEKQAGDVVAIDPVKFGMFIFEP